LRPSGGGSGFREKPGSRLSQNLHRFSNDAGWMIVHCHMCLVGEVQAKHGVVNDAGFWVGATAGTLIGRRALGRGCRFLFGLDRLLVRRLSG
jgi:hypothetical protein